METKKYRKFNQPVAQTLQQAPNNVSRMIDDDRRYIKKISKNLFNDSNSTSLPTHKSQPRSQVFYYSLVSCKILEIQSPHRKILPK